MYYDSSTKLEIKVAFHEGHGLQVMHMHRDQPVEELHFSCK